MGHGGSKSGHSRRGSAGSFLVVGLRWLRGGLGISHFDLVWVNSFYFLHLIRCHVGIVCCKIEGLHHDQTIGALNTKISKFPKLT